MSSCLATEKIVFFLVKTLQDIRTGWHKEDHKHKQGFGLAFCKPELPWDGALVPMAYDGHYGEERCRWYPAHSCSLPESYPPNHSPVAQQPDLRSLNLPQGRWLAQRRRPDPGWTSCVLPSGRIWNVKQTRMDWESLKPSHLSGDNLEGNGSSSLSQALRPASWL